MRPNFRFTRGERFGEESIFKASIYTRLYSRASILFWFAMIRSTISLCSRKKITHSHRVPIPFCLRPESSFGGLYRRRRKASLVRRSNISSVRTKRSFFGGSHAGGGYPPISKSTCEVLADGGGECLFSVLSPRFSNPGSESGGEQLDDHLGARSSRVRRRPRGRRRGGGGGERGDVLHLRLVGGLGPALGAPEEQRPAKTGGRGFIRRSRVPLRRSVSALVNFAAARSVFSCGPHTTETTGDRRRKDAA